jgi:hypothetical protein
VAVSIHILKAYTQKFNVEKYVSNNFLYFSIFFFSHPADSTCGQVAPSLLPSPGQVVKAKILAGADQMET